MIESLNYSLSNEIKKIVKKLVWNLVCFAIQWPIRKGAAITDSGGENGRYAPKFQRVFMFWARARDNG